MAAQQQHHVTSAFLSSGTITVGQCAVKDAAGVGYVASTLTNRTTIGRPTMGIALAAGDLNNTAFEAQVVGEVPPDITDLGDGSESYVKVGDDGYLERSATLDDETVGWCDEDGTAYVCFPLAGMSLGGIITGITGRKVVYGDGTLAGAAHATISTDGYIERGADRTGGAATEGDGRTASGGTEFVRNNGHDGNVAVWSHAGTGALDILTLGFYALSSYLGFLPPTEPGKPQKIINISARAAAILQAGLRGSAPNQIPGAGVHAFDGTGGTNGATGTGQSAHFLLAFPNLLLGRYADSTGLTTDPCKGAEGNFVLRPWVTAPSAAPEAGWLFIRPRATTGEPEYLLHGDDPDTGWRLFGGGWPAPSKVITDADIDADGIVDTLVNGVPALNLFFVTGELDEDRAINGFTAPATGESGAHYLINDLGGEFVVRIANEGNPDSPTSVETISGAEWVLANAVGAYGVVYDRGLERWVPLRGAS